MKAKILGTGRRLQFTRQPVAARSWLAGTLVLGLAYSAAAFGQAEWSRSSTYGDGSLTPASYQSGGLLTYATSGTVHLLRVDPFDVDEFVMDFAAGTVHRRPVLARAPGERVFVASGTGDLHVLSTVSLVQSRDMRRAACPTDSLVAEPIVQLKAESNAQFTLDRDIVMVATAHGCGDTTQNQVIALDAADVTAPPLWVFNSGEYEVGIIRSCALDLERNRIYCGTEHPTSSFQPSLLAIDTNTGALVWSAITDTGVHARSALAAPGGPGEGHLYVGDMLGRVHVFEADDGAAVTWIGVGGGVASGGPTAVVHDLAVGEGPYAGMVFAVSANGYLTALNDFGDDVLEAWQYPFPRSISDPVPISSLGKLYVATADGSFHQLGMFTGAHEASGRLLVTPGSTFQAALSSYHEAADGIYRLVGTGSSALNGTLTKQYRLPCVYASTDCTFDTGYLDTTPPVISPTVSGTQGGEGWYTSDVTVAWTVTDAESGITASSGCETLSVTSDVAESTIVCEATSQGGTNSASVNIKRDATAPAIAVTTPATGARYLLGISVTASYACSDARSGVSTCTGTVQNGVPIDTATAGEKTFSVQASDRAGNPAALTVNYTVAADLTPPTISPNVTGTLGQDGWYSSNVSVSWSVSDPESSIGQQSGCSSTTIKTDTGGTVLTCSATSAGGTATRSITVKRDATAPTVAISSPADGVTYSRNQIVNATYACADALSGVTSCAGNVASGQPIDTSKKAKNARFTVTAVDRAGKTTRQTVSYSVQ
jgi:hypothetical protein